MPRRYCAPSPRNIQRIADGGVNAAEQATMTLDALGTKPEATAPLYYYLEHPSFVPPRASSRPSSKKPPQCNEDASDSVGRRKRLPPHARRPRPARRPCCAPNAHSWRARAGRPKQAAPSPPKPLRKLPRRIMPNLPALPAPVRPEQSPRPLPEDRARPLLRGDITPLPADARQGSPHALPRRPGALMEVEAAMPGVQTTAIPNRWQIFPGAAVPAAMRTSASPPSTRPRACSIRTIATPTRATTRSSAAGSSSPSPPSVRPPRKARRIPVPSVPSSTDPGEFGLLRPRRAVPLPAEFPPRLRPLPRQRRLRARRSRSQRSRRSSTSTTPPRARTDCSPSTCAPARTAPIPPSACRNCSSRSVCSPARRSSISPRVRAGIQRFTSDFRGLIFSDEQPGARLFGNFHNNVFQYNLAYFNMLEKDANSGLNHWQSRRQQVYAANLYWSDFLTKGYTLNFSALYNHDQPSFLVDKNGFLVRPAPVGLPAAAQGARRLCRHFRRRPHQAHQRLARLLPGLRPRRFQPDPGAQESAAHQRATGLRRSRLREGLDGMEGQRLLHIRRQESQRRPRQRLRRHRARTSRSPAADSWATPRWPIAACSTTRLPPAAPIS